MKIAVLGGMGMQGRAALKDLSASQVVDEVICADSNLDAWPGISRHMEEFAANSEKKRIKQEHARMATWLDIYHEETKDEIKGGTLDHPPYF